ncbi:E-beta-farnesene synthase [Tanacetum coccineum]
MVQPGLRLEPTSTNEVYFIRLRVTAKIIKFSIKGGESSWDRWFDGTGAGPNPDDVAESQPLPTPSVLAGPNLEHSDVEITDASSQPQPDAYDFSRRSLVSSTKNVVLLQHLTKDFSYGDQFIDDKPSEANYEKMTADTEAESMVSVTIQQDTSVIPPMDINFSSKTTASAEYSAWTMTDTRIKPSITTIPDDLYMDDETTADEQAYSIEKRASASEDNIVPPLENSLLAQTGDIATFMDWYCKRQGISELTPKDLEGPAYEIVKVFQSSCSFSSSKWIISGVSSIRSQDWQTSLVYLKNEGGFYQRCRALRATGDRISSGLIEEGETAERHKTHMRILSVIRIEVFSMYGYNYMKKIILSRADSQGICPSRKGISNICTLLKLDTSQRVQSQQDKSRDEYKILDEEDVVRCIRSTCSLSETGLRPSIFRNLESFVGGRIREGDYRPKPLYRAVFPDIRVIESTHNEDGKFLLKPTSNKLFEIPLKRNLPDHRIKQKMEMDIPLSSWIISQSPRGIFLKQSKYALESLKMYGMETCEPATDTPMVEKSKHDDDLQGNVVDPTRYRGMIGTLMYLTSIIMEYLVNISQRRAFWSLNEDILKINVLTTNTPYPSRKIRCICACTHQRPRMEHDQNAVSREAPYTPYWRCRSKYSG